MAREVIGRLMLRGRLECRTALHVGGREGDADADMALAVNGQGQHYVPGTSLAGALREWCLGRAGEEVTRAVFGFQDPEAGAASLLLVEDAPVAIPAGATVEIRQGVGIDRVTGAAAEHVKFERAVLPRGTTLPLCLAVELTAGRAGQAREVMAGLAVALSAGEIRLGAARTRGLGRVVLGEVELVEQDLSSRKGLLAALRSGGRKLDLSALPAPAWPGGAAPRLELEVEWAPAGAFMVKADRDGNEVDALPMTAFVGDRTTPVLPGSSVKGALRSHAERIVRTVLGLRAQGEFLNQVRVPLVDELFGSTGEGAEEPATGPLLGRGAFGVDDCYARLRLPPRAWRQVEQAGTANALRKALESTGAAARFQQAFHVAVDRWTGGASDQALFSVLEPHGVEWEPIRITVELSRVPPQLQRPALALVLVAVQDLGAGRIPLGHAVNRGMGDVRVGRVKLGGSGLEGLGLSALAGATLEHGALSSLPRDLYEVLQADWRTWATGQGRQS